MRIYEERELTSDEQEAVVANLPLIGLAHSRYPRLAARVGPDSEGIAALGLCLAVQRVSAGKGKLSTYALVLIRGLWMDSINRSELAKWRAGRGVTFDAIGDVEPFDRAPPPLEFDEVEAIHAAIGKLSAPRAASVRACLMLGLSCSEHAAIAGVSPAAVKQTRKAGLEQLRELLSV